MRNGLNLLCYLVFLCVLLPLPATATLIFRIYTAGPQAGEIHIDSPQGSFFYFRPDTPEEQMPQGFCGMRWTAPPENMAWYWGSPGRLLFLPSNGVPAPELSYQLPYSTCANGNSGRQFDTPATPDGQAPPDARLLVVEVPGWENVSFINRQQGRLPTPGNRAPAEEAGICLRYPAFCTSRPGLESITNDPCRHAAGNDLICQVLPNTHASLTRLIDLTSAMAYQYRETEEFCLLHLYRRSGARKVREKVQANLASLSQAQNQFRQLHTSYRRIDAPLKRMNSYPFSHYIHATATTQLDLAEVWLFRCQQKLRDIEAAVDSRAPWQPRPDFEALERYRFNACHHLQEAKFWLERQHAWAVPMER